MSLKKPAIVVLSALGLAVATAATGWGNAAASAIQAVVISNGPANPVPVRATGLVPVHEEGTANVNVTNAPLPVSIVNKSLRMSLPLVDETQTGQLEAAPGANAVQSFGHVLYTAGVNFNTSKTPATVSLLNGDTVTFTEDLAPESNYFLPFTALLQVTGVRLDCDPSGATDCRARFNIMGMVSPG
jgi:hypothetical protein